MDLIEVCRVKFLWPGKMFEFVNSNNLTLKRDDKVIVATYEGETMVGTVSIPPRIRARAPDDEHLSPVIRLATEQDLGMATVQDEFRRDVKQFFDTRIRSRQISAVRMIDCEKADAGRKLIVYFSSENNRLPLRDLAMELGHKFNMRIDLRPVGIRDAARLAGGIGKCGLSMCCSTWITDFSAVSIRMAKDQGLSLEPESISGQCGRLLCCLGYEHENYVALGASLPKVGKVVVTPVGDARVVKLDIIQGMVTVRTEDGTYETFPGNQVKRKFGPGGPGGGGGNAKGEADEDDDSSQESL